MSIADTEKQSKGEFDRRDLIRALPRLAIIGGLASLGGFLAVKRVKALGDQDCINDSYCRKCPRIEGACNLPQALSFRQVTGQGKGDLS